MRLYIRESLAAYTGAGRVLRREEQIRINQAIGSCGFSMLNLGAYLSGANDEEKGATVFAVQSTRKLSRTEYSITINDEAGAGFAIANGINSASLVMSVSETMNVRRFGITRTVSFRQLKAVAAVLKSGGVMTDLQLSTVFGCPFEEKNERRHCIATYRLLLSAGNRRRYASRFIGRCFADRNGCAVSSSAAGLSPPDYYPSSERCDRASRTEYLRSCWRGRDTFWSDRQRTGGIGKYEYEASD